jgi:hypothetical protein
MNKYLLFATLLACSSAAQSFEEFDERYPRYSVPIWKEEAIQYLNTNPPSQTIKSYSFSDVSYTTNKSFYFSGETIRLNLDFFLKKPKFEFLEITFHDEYSDEKVQIKPKILGIGQTKLRYFTEVVAPETTFDKTYLFHVSITNKGIKHKLSVPVVVGRKTGNVIEVGKPEQDNTNNLVIPVLVEIQEPGMYRISGNVFINKVPVARLSDRVYLDSIGRVSIPLKIYGKLIIDRKIYGDADLVDVVIEKIQMSPEDTGGKSDAAKFIINVPQGFQDKPYSSL